MKDGRPAPKNHPWRTFVPPLNSEEQKLRRERVLPYTANPLRRYFPK